MTKKRAHDLLAELQPDSIPDLMPGHPQDMPQFEEVVAKVLKAK